MNISGRLCISSPRERGFSIVTAIFVLVVMALLGLYMVTIGDAQRATVTYAVQGARAYQAARAGIDWGVHKVINTSLGTMCSLDPATFTTGPFSPGATGLQDFQVTVECTYTTHTETSNTYQVFRLKSTAKTAAATFGTPHYYSRTVHASVTNAP